MPDQARVAIIGSGKIGIDLIHKVIRSAHLDCVLLAGRSKTSAGLQRARDYGVRCSDGGIEAVMDFIDDIDIVIDATSASAHREHWQLLRETKARVIDMTPSGVGEAVVPSAGLGSLQTAQNVNMVSCGGQASIPLIDAVTRLVPNIEYVEVVSSIASLSAGPATRLNIDEYVATTEAAVRRFGLVDAAKVILNLNPANPPVHMQTTVSFLIADSDVSEVQNAIELRVREIKTYVPGYELLVPPRVIERNRLIMTVRVTGAGDYLPPYAGNLDIINAAAVRTAECMASHAAPEANER